MTWIAHVGFPMNIGMTVIDIDMKNDERLLVCRIV